MNNYGTYYKRRCVVRNTFMCAAEPSDTSNYALTLLDGLHSAVSLRRRVHAPSRTLQYRISKSNPCQGVPATD